jgi:hypothetical protein
VDVADHLLAMIVSGLRQQQQRGQAGGDHEGDVAIYRHAHDGVVLRYGVANAATGRCAHPHEPSLRRRQQTRDRPAGPPPGAT